MVKAASDLFFSGARCVATSLWVKTIALRAGLFGDSVRPTFIHIFSHRTRKKKKKKSVAGLRSLWSRASLSRTPVALTSHLTTRRTLSTHSPLLATRSRSYLFDFLPGLRSAASTTIENGKKN